MTKRFKQYTWDYQSPFCNCCAFKTKKQAVQDAIHYISKGHKKYMLLNKKVVAGMTQKEINKYRYQDAKKLVLEQPNQGMVTIYEIIFRPIKKFKAKVKVYEK